MIGEVANLPQAGIFSNSPEHLQGLQISCVKISDGMQGQGWPTKLLLGRCWKNSNIKIQTQIQICYSVKSRNNYSQSLKEMLEILPVFLSHHLESRDFHQIAIALTVQGQQTEMKLLLCLDQTQFQS